MRISLARFKLYLEYPDNSEAAAAAARRSMAPMTQAEWEQRRSVVRRVLDPDTGRHRLVKGDGEILEEIVSYRRHREIREMATRMDGAAFQRSIGLPPH